MPTPPPPPCARCGTPTAPPVPVPQVPIQEGATVANERPLQWVPLHTQSAAHVPLVKAFSAVCWHFAVHLYRALNPGPTAQRPLGLVQLTEDGTPINRFLSPARLEQCPRDLRRCRQPPGGDGCAQYEAQMLRRERRFTERGLWDSCLWPALHGMGGLPLRAFLWYQGETDKQWQGRYRCLHRELVRQVRAEAGWRGVPFVFTVVAPDLGAKGLLPFLRCPLLQRRGGGGAAGGVCVLGGGGGCGRCVRVGGGGGGGGRCVRVGGGGGGGAAGDVWGAGGCGRCVRVGGGSIGPHAHRNAARHVVDDRNAKGSGQQKS